MQKMPKESRKIDIQNMPSLPCVQINTLIRQNEEITKQGSDKVGQRSPSGKGSRMEARKDGIGINTQDRPDWAFK